MNAFIRILGFCLSLLLFTYGPALSQNNLAVQLTESSVLLDQLVVCGDIDFQTVIISIDGNSTADRSNVLATLQLFDGIIFDQLDSAASTPGIRLLDANSLNQARFSIPDMNPAALSEVQIAFSVRADCDIVAAINANNELQVFDTWILDYTLDGTSFSETNTGVEYKNTIAIPNLSIGIQAISAPVSLGNPFEREIRIINSGLNSYLDEFAYQIIPEPGIQYQSLFIGDVPLPFSKTLNSNGDTVLIALIDNSFFFANTVESGLPGLGDNRFDVDEVLSITETLIITDCGQDGNFNLNTSHEVSWGCSGNTCQQEQMTASLNLGIGEEQIQFTVGKDTIDPSYCTEGTTSLFVANNGFEFDAGFGTILDVVVGIGFANGERFTLAEDGYQITSLQIGETIVFFPDSLTNLSTNDFFREDPDGEGGLEDIDQDGFFDDLAVGNSFTATATYQIDCSSSADIDLLAACDNDFRGNFDGRIRYSNSCGVATEKNIDNFFRSFNSGGTKEICADPDALNEGDQFAIVYSGERRQSNFAACNGADELRAVLTLPTGIELAATTFLEQDSLSFIPSIQQNEGEWTLIFDASTLNLNNDYNLNLLFNTQCTPTGFTSFPIQIEYYCPECDCGQLWYCGVLEGTLLHASGPPCSEVTCDIGIAVNNFKVERTTFGYTDATFTTPFDPAAANKAIALTCDSVLMTVETTIGEQPLSDSIGLMITYGNADGSTSNKTSFLFSKGDISIIATNGDITKCTINEEQLVVDTSNSTKQMFFDLSVCLEGRTLVTGEKIEFKGFFAVNPEAPIPSNDFKKIPQFRAAAYATVDGLTYDNCESYGQFFRLAKLDTKFSGPNNTTYPEGCAATSMIYSLDKSINANAMRTFFGEEHRQATKINNVQITYDPAILTAFSDLSVSYRTLDNEWLPLSDFFQFPAGTYETTFEGNTNVSTITGSNQLFQLKIDAIPTCAAAFSSSDGNASYAISTTLEYDNRYYANFIDTGSCVEQKMEVENRSILYEHPPSFSLEGIEQDVVTGSTQAQWLIQHCNTSFNADASLTWIALELPTDSITITAIDLLSQDGSMTLLPFQEYGAIGNKVFAIAPGLNKNIDGNSNDDVCNTYRITADLAICGRHSIDARLGWNCTDFDQTDWTPDLYEPCEEQNIALSFTTLFPFLAADYLVESSDISNFLCDTSLVDIVLRNEEMGRAYNINSRITIPVGARLVPGSVAFAYPSSNASIAIPTDPILIEENTAAGTVYQYADFSSLNAYLHENGLPGFKVTAPDSSEFRLSYRLVSDCNFENGSVNRYRFQGSSACGATTNIAFAETSPFIFQIDPTIARKFDVALINQEPITSGIPATIELEINNIGKNPSIIDSINLALPASISYVPNSTLALALLDWDLEEPRLIDNDSIQEIRFPLPIGLRNQERVTLSFDVVGTDIDCSRSISTTISTISTAEFFCQINNENCLIDFVSSDSTQFIFDCGLADPCLAINKILSDTLVIPSCENTISYCFPLVSPEDRRGYTLTDNGTPIDLISASTCNFQQICIYSYGNIVNVVGPIEVLMWEVDGQNFTGTAPNIVSLVDSMNVWNPTGNWVINFSSVVIEGGHEEGTYSPMQVLLPTSNLQSVLGYDARVTPRGTAVELTSGNHELVLEYPNGCTDSISILVLEQDCETCNPAIIQSIITENTSCNQSNGRIQINVSGDLANYDFEWSPDVGISGSTANIKNGLFTGGYRVKIRNRAEGCFIEEFIVVQNEDGPSLDNAQTTISSCNTGTGTATLSPENYMYTWSDGGSGATRMDMRVGTYYVTFTDPNNPDCPNINLVEILDNNTLKATLDVIEFPGCNDTNGEVSIAVTGGGGNYDFSFLSGTNTQDGLSNGTYQVLISDIDTGCELPYTFFLESRETIETMTLTGTTNVSCVGANDGQVSVDIQYSSDFLFPVDTLITDGINQFINGQLPAGDYFVYIKDITGCVTASVPFSITTSIPQEVTVSKMIDCEAGAAIQIAVLDSNDIQSYDWLDIPGPDNERNRTGLVSGTYELVITDNRTCTTSLAIELQACCIPANVEDAITTNAACGEATGTVELVLEQAVADYTYTFNPDVGTVGTTINIRQDLPAGAYEVMVAYKGDSTCSETIVVFVEEAACCTPPLIVDTQTISADCEEATGRIEIILEQAITDYNFTYSPNEGLIGDSPNIRLDLPAGNYEVNIASVADTTCKETIQLVVEADDCCIAPNIVDVVSSNAACGEATGSIEILLEQEIGDYTFMYSPALGRVGASANIQQQVPAGAYEVTVTYQGDTTCSETILVLVEEDNLNNLITSQITPASCGNSDGAVRLTVLGASGSYTFAYPPNAGEVGATPNVQQNLAAGEYDVVITFNGIETCPQVLTLTVPEEKIDLIIRDTIINAAACGEANGQVEVVVADDVDKYSYVFNPDAGEVGATANSRRNLAAGTYEVSVAIIGSDVCTETITITIPTEENSEGIIRDTIINAAACGEANGQVEIVVAGDVDKYSYVFNPSAGEVGATANSRRNLAAGAYEVTVAVIGSEVCTETIAITIPNEELGDIITDTTVTNADCGTDNGRVEVLVLGNPTDYTYTLEPNNGREGSTPNNIENLAAGTYNLTVSLDGNDNCSQNITFDILNTSLTDLIADTTITPASCGMDNGQILFDLSYDLSDYIITYEPNLGIQGASLNSREELPAGTYTATINYKEDADCTQLVSFTIPEEVVSDIVTNTITLPSDCGVSNGTATLIVEGSPLAYSFTWPEGIGEAGDTPNTRNGLATGTYRVLVAPIDNPICTQEVQVEIPLGNTTTSPIISDNVVNPSCGETNGMVTLTLADPIENYQIEWVPDIGIFGASENIRTNLPGGDYQILVTDKRDTVCVSRVTLNLINEMPTTNVVSIAASCQEAADGAIRLSPESFVYTWEDGFIGSDRNELLAADYAITITDTTATDICQSTLAVTLSADNTLSAMATINSQPSCAGNDGAVSINVQGTGDTFSYSWESESAIDSTLAAGIYTVTVTDISSGCTTTIAFDLADPNIGGMCDPVDCDLKVGRDTIIMQTDDCIEVASICLDYLIDNDNPLLLSVNGFATPIGNVDPCRVDSLGIYTYSNLFGQGEVGPYEINAWPVNDTIYTGTFNTILDLVDSMNVWDPAGNWTISDEGLFIIGMVGNSIYEPMQVFAPNVGATATLGYNARNDASGIATFVEMGLHEIILSDPQTSCSDSILVIAACIFTDTTSIRILPNQKDTTCFSTEDLVGDLVSITISCLQNETAQVEVFGDSCIIITGQNPGTDTACVVICDAFGVCDTNIVGIQILLMEYADSVEIGSSEEVCIDAGSIEIGGPINSIEILDTTDAVSPTIVYEIDPFTNCITYSADALGIDTTYFAFCDAMGGCDTIPFIFNVFNDPPDRIEDTIFINETVTYCFDQNIFSGELTVFENICPTASGQFVDFFLDPLSFCVEYSGVALGRDSACIVLCDNLGNCDTAFFDVLVVEFKELPIAVNDLDTTTLGTPIVIDILSNDTPFGVPDDGITIIEAPLYGAADLNLDGSVTYTSDEFCARSDQFTYAICNDIGCDTATVEVWIECIDIVIFSAVSPNRDDINDVFYISGIEEFPQSRLQIFNRWGERVFDKINYDNTWSGTWKGNRELPDGAYFYCLELNDDEERVFQGFLEIHR